MVKFQKVLKEDLKTYMQGLSKIKLDFCNIICNRMNTNAVILESKEFILLSVVLKDLTERITRNIDPDEQINLSNQLKSLVSNFLKDDDQPNITSILELSDFFREILGALATEEENYKENIEFTEKTTKFCLQFLSDEITNKNIIVRSTAIFPGVLNELLRVFRTHGFHEKHFLLKYILGYSARVFEYLRFAIFYSADYEKEVWTKRVEDFFRMIQNNIKCYLVEESDQYREVSLNLLSLLCKEWRVMYIRFMEISPVVKKEKKDLELPPDIKEKMKEIVSKGVQTELEHEN